VSDQHQNKCESAPLQLVHERPARVRVAERGVLDEEHVLVEAGGPSSVDCTVVVWWLYGGCMVVAWWLYGVTKTTR
jgi:hypothetical protein